jgi:hypothetical protein
MGRRNADTPDRGPQTEDTRRPMTTSVERGVRGAISEIGLRYFLLASGTHDVRVTPLGSGQYGDVYLLRCQLPETLQKVVSWVRSPTATKHPPLAVESCCRARDVVTALGHETEIVVKLQPLADHREERVAIQEEHCHIRAFRCRTRFPSGTTVEGSSFVPKPYGGATLVFCDALKTVRYRMTLMEHVRDAVTMTQHVRSNRGMDFQTYWHLEASMCAMWLRGIIHGDVHPENVLVRHDGTICLLDFGMAIMLPPRLRRDLDRALSSKRPEADPDECLNDELVKYVQGVMRRRGIDVNACNLDHDMLAWVRTICCLVGDEKLLKRNRTCLWSPGKRALGKKCRDEEEGGLALGRSPCGKRRCVI